MSTRAEASSQGARAAHPYSMSRKNESVAWRAFVKLGGNKVICRICNKQMNYQSGSSTSNMVKHLQAVHKHILADVKPNSNSGNNNSASNPPPPAAALVKGADDLSTVGVVGVAAAASRAGAERVGALQQVVPAQGGPRRPARSCRGRGAQGMHTWDRR